MLRTIIFDFDGTLADTLPLCYYSFQNVFGNLIIKKLLKQRFFLCLAQVKLVLFMRTYSLKKEVAVERYYECYEEKHHDYVERNHEIVDLLIHLKTRVSVSYRNWKSKKKPRHFSKSIRISFFLRLYSSWR